MTHPTTPQQLNKRAMDRNNYSLRYRVSQAWLFLLALALCAIGAAVASQIILKWAQLSASAGVAL